MDRRGGKRGGADIDLGLNGKVAWLTGASSGIGRAAAESLAREGASVAISSRGEERLATAASEIADATGSRCIPLPLDISDHAAIEGAHARVLDELGAVDILLANAGGPPPGTFDTVNDDKLSAGFDSTIAGPWNLVRAVVPGMKEKGAGALIFVTSWSTKEVIPGLLLSNMLRASIVGFAKTLSKELGPHGIRTACIAPGRIDTDRLRELDEINAERSGRTVDEVRTASAETIPLRRYGRPEELGDVIAFLASERASYITGVTSVIDGGLLNGLLS